MGHLRKTNNFQDQCYSLCEDGQTIGPTKRILYQFEMTLKQSYQVHLFTCHVGPCIHVLASMNRLLCVGQGFITWDTIVVSNWSVDDLKYKVAMKPTLMNVMPCACNKNVFVEALM